MKLSKNIQKLKPSGTMSLFARVAELREAGIEVISLGIGELDSATPDNAKNAGITAITENRTRYTVNRGTLELRRAICEKFKTDNGLEYNPDQILVSNGAKQCLFNLLFSLCNEGDEVLVIGPYYTSYLEQIKACGGIPVVVQTSPENGFQLTTEILKSKISDKTRGIIVNSPNNPTGAVYDHRSIGALAKVVIESDLWVLSDEIYEKITFPPAFHISPAQHSPAMFERTFVVNGFSKAFAMTGWRLGYCAGPKEIIDAASLLQSHSTSNASTISQAAGLVALTEDQEFTKNVAADLLKKRNLAIGILEGTNNVKIFSPSGSFYLWLEIGDIKTEEASDSSDLLARYLLEKQQVAVVPGSAFGSENFLRISFAVSRETLEEGCKRIKKGLEQYRY